MKIRTDFVTNSSSSSYITLHVTTNKKSYIADFNSGDQGWGIEPSDPFSLTKEEFLHLGSGEELIAKVKEWFDDTFSDPELPKTFNYADGNIEEIRMLKREDIRSIRITSATCFDEYENGGETIFIYETGKLTYEDRSREYGEDTED